MIYLEWTLNCLAQVKHTLRASAVVNCTMGVGLILFGALSSQKWTAVLGGLSIVGSVISSEEAKKK